MERSNARDLRYGSADESPCHSGGMSEDLIDPVQPSPLRTGPGWIALRIVAAMIAMPAAGLVGASPVLLARPFLSGTPQAVQMILFILIGLFTAGLYVLFAWVLARFIDRSTLRRCGVIFTTRGLLALVGVTALMVAIVVPLGVVLRTLGLASEIDYDTGGKTVDAVVSGLGLAFLYQGFGEELLWRGYLQRHLPMGLKPAIWVSAAAFGVMHLVSSGGQQNALDHVLYLITPFGFAVLAGVLAAKTGSLWAAVGVHGGSHTAHLVLAFLGVGDDSRGMWIGEGLVCLVIALGVMATLPKIPATSLQSNLPAGTISRRLQVAEPTV